MENNEVTRTVPEVETTPETEVETVPEAEVETTPETSAEEVHTYTAEEHQAEADAKLARIGELCAMSLAAYTNPKHEPSYGDIVHDLMKLMQEYNWHSKAAKICQVAAAEDPMLEAVKILEYTRVSIREKSQNVGGGLLHWQEYKTTQKRLDLTELATYCKQNGVTFGKNPDWFYTIEKLCCVLTLAHAKELGIPADQIDKIDGSFLMSKVARDVQLAAEDPTNPSPLSKAQISKNLTLVLSQMVGEAYHTDTRDAAFLKMCFAGQGKASLSAKTANAKRLADIILQVAHRSCFDKAYTIQAATRKERS